MEESRVFSTQEEMELGHQIVAEELGDDFQLNFGLYPHNKGLKGDEGIYGETVEIEGDIPNTIQFLVEERELLARISNRLCNELPAVSKVLFNIAKRDTGPNLPNL